MGWFPLQEIREKEWSCIHSSSAPTSNEAMEELPKLSKLQLPHLRHGDDSSNHSMLLRRLRKVSHARDLPLPKCFLPGQQQFLSSVSFYLGFLATAAGGPTSLHSPTCLHDLQSLPLTTLHFKPTVIAQRAEGRLTASSN